MYTLIKPLLFRFQPERAHYMAMAGLSAVHKLGLAPLLFGSTKKPEPLRLMGLEFPNRVGLGAGFDKDARWIDALASLGFGFIEVGTLTPKAQPGNDKPRLFRLTDDEALINRMGFNNRGVDAAVERIKASKRPVPIGGNIGKNKVTTAENAPDDYLRCFQKLYAHVDYFTVNISSPNTPGLRDLQSGEEIKRIFTPLLNERVRQAKQKPALVKIAPDLSDAQVEEIVAVVKALGIDGIVATNTTISRAGLCSPQKLIGEAGGLSGKPVRQRSTEVIRLITQLTNGTLPVIGVGGIHSAADAQEKFDAGAALIQLYTGFIYEGPKLIKNINERIK